MQMQTAFHQTEKMLTHILYDSGMENTILRFWRENQPELVEELLLQQMLKKTLMQKANDLFDLQISLEKTEKLPPSLAEMEAWRILMRPTTQDEEDEEEMMGEMDL
ncbi:MAG: hypothetical protein P4M13_02655 [Alphaproteobacteria bacterium]|nr:hypothetical protein [Alphaproteobacteria bacterium]